MSTSAVWITRETTTVRHARGLIEALERAGALDYASLRILTLADDRGVVIPDGFRLPDGGDPPAEQLFTPENLPAEGILLVPDDG